MTLLLGWDKLQQLRHRSCNSPKVHLGGYLQRDIRCREKIEQAKRGFDANSSHGVETGW